MEDGKETEQSVKQQIDDAVKKEEIKEVVKTLFGELLGGLFDEDKGE